MCFLCHPYAWQNFCDKLVNRIRPLLLLVLLLWHCFHYQFHYHHYYTTTTIIHLPLLQVCHHAMTIVLFYTIESQFNLAVICICCSQQIAAPLSLHVFSCWTLKRSEENIFPLKVVWPCYICITLNTLFAYVLTCVLYMCLLWVCAACVCCCWLCVCCTHGTHILRAARVTSPCVPRCHSVVRVPCLAA